MKRFALPEKHGLVDFLAFCEFCEGLHSFAFVAVNLPAAAAFAVFPAVQNVACNISRRIA